MAILDQINVKESEQDPTGVDYDIRDRELHTATGQSTVNTSDVVLLKDTNGKYHEITKDSFMSAVRGALGSLIKGYDKGTAINGIAVTGSAGTVNDLGFSSPSDLASVLGVLQPKEVKINGDLNDLKSSQITIVTNGVSNRPSNVTSIGTVIVLPSIDTGADIIQLYVDGGYGSDIIVGLYARNYVVGRETWCAWSRLDQGAIPSFYKDYADLSSLASALGVQMMPNFVVKNAYDEKSFYDMVRSNTWQTNCLHIGCYHPNMYSLYVMYVQDGTQDSDGKLRYAQGMFVLDGVVHGFTFVAYTYEVHP